MLCRGVLRESGKREREEVCVCSKMCRLESIYLSILLCVFIPHYIRYAAATPSDDDDDDEVVVRGAEESSTETRRQDVSLVFYRCLEKTTKAFANDDDFDDARERGRDWKGEAKKSVCARVVVRTGKRLWRKRRAKDDDDDDDDDDDPRRRRKKSTTTTGC